MNSGKSFLIGSVIGDGTRTKRVKVGDYTIEFDQKNKEWLENLSKVFLEEFGKGAEVRPTKRGYFRLRIHSKRILQDVENLVNSFPSNISTTELQGKFLQGFFDSEGSVHKTKFRITLSNNNEKLIKISKTFLNNFGIEAGKVRKEKWGAFVLPINGRENLRKFHNLIGFTHPEKNERLISKILT